MLGGLNVSKLIVHHCVDLCTRSFEGGEYMLRSLTVYEVFAKLAASKKTLYGIFDNLMSFIILF